MLKWMHHIHLLNFLLKTFFFCLLLSFFQLALLRFLLISLFDSSSSQGHLCVKVLSDTGADTFVTQSLNGL